MTLVGSRRRVALVPILGFLVVVSAFPQRIPSPDGSVNDFANVISSRDEQTIRATIDEVRRRTTAEIAVLTVDSIAPYGSIEEYGIAVADAWGVGDEKTDNGVILIVSVGERRLRLEVGYGLEGAIPDGRAGAILDEYVVPDLRRNDYGTGIRKGVTAVAHVIAEEYGVQLTGVERPAAAPASSSNGFDLSDLFYVALVIIGLLTRSFLWPLFFVGRRRGFHGGGFGTFFGGSSGGRSSGGFGGGGFSGGGFGGGGASRGF